MRRIIHTVSSPIFAISFFLFCFPIIGLHAEKVNFNYKRGYYSSPFQLVISSDIPSAQIRYTLNGTAPGINSGLVYSGPITIDKTTVVRVIAYSINVDTSAVHTHSYFFVNNIIQQPYSISGWPNKTYSVGLTGTALMDYEMDPDIVNDPNYHQSLIDGFFNIPTMSIVMDKADFQSMYDDQGGNIEKPTSIEIIYPNDQSKNEQADCGIEGHSWRRLKRSMRLSFKKIYGEEKLKSDIFRNAPLNGSSATNEFDAIILRAGNNRSWARNFNPDRTCYTRDQWYRDSQIAMSGVGSHGTFVHLFVNGIYWGLYNPVERPDESFSTSYYVGNKADWLAISEAGVYNGDSARYHYLINTLIKKNLSVDANYQEFQQYLDVEQFCDYLIDSWFIGKTDWPQNNWWGGNNNNPASTFKYYAWDAEWSLDTSNGSNNGAWVHPQFRSNKSGGVPLVNLWHAARRNKNFMLTFADRVYKHCYNNGALTDYNSRKRWADLNNFIRDAIVAESARWGDGLNDGVTRTRDGYWQPEVNRVDAIFNGNVQRFIDALRTEGYYPSIDAPLFSCNDTIITGTYHLIMTDVNGAGTIYYTLDGSDPRAGNGNVSGAAISYTADVSVNKTMTVKARIKSGNIWSALHEIQIVVTTTAITINEIESASSARFLDEAGEQEDWIEIFNSSSSDIDLAGFYISDDPSKPFKYQIPENASAKTTVPAFGFLVLVADKQPEQGSNHVDFKLNSSGGKVTLYQKSGNYSHLVDSVSYLAHGADSSYGRFPDGGSSFYYFQILTPLASNDTTKVIINSTTQEPFSGILIYPNPSRDELYIKMEKMDNNEIQVQLCDMNGIVVREIFNGKTPTGNNQIYYDIKDLKPGAYLLNINSGANKKSFKLIKN